MLDSGKMFYIPIGIVKGFIQRVYFYKVRQRFDIRVKNIRGKDLVWLNNDFRGPKEFDLIPYKPKLTAIFGDYWDARRLPPPSWLVRRDRGGVIHLVKAAQFGKNHRAAKRNANRHNPAHYHRRYRPEQRRRTASANIAHFI